MTKLPSAPPGAPTINAGAPGSAYALVGGSAVAPKPTSNASNVIPFPSRVQYTRLTVKFCFIARAQYREKSPAGIRRRLLSHHSEWTRELNDSVRNHYNASGLTELLKAVLGPGTQQLTPQQLAPLDQFHTRGLAATADLAKLIGITADMSDQDNGNSERRPARFLAETYGCRVT